ncbi:FK506-binding protein 5-like [Homalodisca vitripennis]|uniref:FK506-binding protein 5-like n=1 Tax=Homalodisca vitripennis TaxID=197043 RepID=UPI001EEA5781|nr:FK506-binding protein 5-like [Homalodisca vitripennis]
MIMSEEWVSSGNFSQALKTSPFEQSAQNMTGQTGIHTSLVGSNSSPGSLLKEKTSARQMGSKEISHTSASKSASIVGSGRFEKTGNSSDEITGHNYKTESFTKVKSQSMETTRSHDKPEEPEQNYYGWDGYESRFMEDVRESITSIPKCIPPWAKTVRTKYGYAPLNRLEQESEESKKNMRDKIEKLMKKHSDLMLVKRVESRKQLILEPSKKYDEMDVVKMKAKNTKYYMTPMTKNDEKQFRDDFQIIKDGRSSEKLYTDKSDSSMSVMKKTSKPQVKKEISSVLESLNKPIKSVTSEGKNYETKIGKESGKCPKVTLSKIREYVKAQTMDPDERRLHEIIKVEKVPSADVKDVRRLGSKYIINVPQSKPTDKATINKIKIKEKRKLKLHNIEDVKEKVTEFRYTQDGTKRESKNKTTTKESSEITEQLKKEIKSPTETTTFQVTSKKTPIITPLIDEKKTDKVLLIQYEKKSKQGETRSADGKTTLHKTQLLGIKQRPCEDVGEMYLYGTETIGTKTKENITNVDGIPLSLKDKVNLIFQELREMSLTPEPEIEMIESAAQICPEVSSKVTQRPSELGTDVAMVQAVPEVKSAEVQVRESLLTMQDSFLSVPPPSYDITPKMEKTKENITDLLEKKLKDLEKEEDQSPSESDAELKEKVERDLSEKDAVDEDKKGGFIEEEEEEEEEEGKPGQPEIAIESERLSELEESKIEEPTEVTEELAKMSEEEDQKIDEEPTEEQPVDDEKVIEHTLDEKKTSIELLTKTPSKDLKIPSKILEEDKEDIHSKLEEEKLEVPVEKRTTSLDEKKELEGVEIDTTKRRDVEDIRSYEFDKSQETTMKSKSTSKFLHDKDKIRSRMNWTKDTIYLEKHTCPQLVQGLAITAMRRPADPISFLAHWIYKSYENQEREEHDTVFKEHLQLAKTMLDVRGETKLPRKFNTKTYPVKTYSPEQSQEDFSKLAEGEKEGGGEVEGGGGEEGGGGGGGLQSEIVQNA